MMTSAIAPPNEQAAHAALRDTIEAAWAARDSGRLPDGTREAVESVLDELESGRLRVAVSGGATGLWHVNDWLKKAVLLYFRLRPAEPMEDALFRCFDKVPLRGGDWAEAGVRVVPGAIVRRGAFVGTGAILMPSFVNIGAWVGPGTMIDTWATVGSCAQVGANCHISGGAGIGGVLEPLQAAPVVIEDGCFIGARCEVAEGARVGAGAVLAMGCYLGASTRIFNALDGTTTRGHVPPRAVVVPGALPSADGTHSTYALIIKKFRDAQTDAKTALNDVLRS